MEKSIIIPVYYNYKITEECLLSIEKYTQDYELIIINNSPDDIELNKVLSKRDCVIINNTENKGVAKSWNQGIERAKGKYLIFLNNDVIVGENWLDDLISGLENHWIACVECGREFAGWCFAITRGRLDYIGKFDEQFEMMWFEDTDYKYRILKSGGKINRVKLNITHLSEQTSSKLSDAGRYKMENEKKFINKWNENPTE